MPPELTKGLSCFVMLSDILVHPVTGRHPFNAFFSDECGMATKAVGTIARTSMGGFDTHIFIAVKML